MRDVIIYPQTLTFVEDPSAYPYLEIYPTRATVCIVGMRYSLLLMKQWIEETSLKRSLGHLVRMVGSQDLAPSLSVTYCKSLDEATCR